MAFSLFVMPRYADAAQASQLAATQRLKEFHRIS